MLIDFEAWLANLVDKALSSSPFPLDSLISAADKNHSQTNVPQLYILQKN